MLGFKEDGLDGDDERVPFHGGVRSAGSGRCRGWWTCVVSCGADRRAWRRDSAAFGTRPLWGSSGAGHKTPQNVNTNAVNSAAMREIRQFKPAYYFVNRLLKHILILVSLFVHAQNFKCYIYAFSRRFYPKQLTVHSGYTFSLVHVFPGNRTHNLLRSWHNALTTKPQEHINVIVLLYYYYIYQLTN